MSQRIHHNRRHLRVLVLIGLFGLGALAFLALALEGARSGSNDNILLGSILGGFFVLATGGLEFFAQRYVYALHQDDSRIDVETLSLRGRRSHGPVTQIGAPILENSEGLNHQYCRLVVGPGSKTYILDLTADPALAKRLAHMLRNPDAHRR